MVESIYLINNKNKVGANVSCLSAPYLDTAQGQDRQSKFRAQILQTSWKKEFTKEKRAGVCTVIRQSNLMNPRLCPYHFHLHPNLSRLLSASVSLWSLLSTPLLNS